MYLDKQFVVNIQRVVNDNILLIVELLASTKFVFKWIIPVYIQFALDPECRSSDLRRIIWSSRKLVVTKMIWYPRSIKIGLSATGNLLIVIN